MLVTQWALCQPDLCVMNKANTCVLCGKIWVLFFFFFFDSKSTVSFSLNKYFIVHSEIEKKQKNSAKFHLYPKPAK